MLRKINCNIYKLNKKNGIIENTDTTDVTMWTKEIVKIGNYLNAKNIEYNVVNNYSIRIGED